MRLDDQTRKFLSSKNVYSLVSESPLGVCITDERGIFVFVNNAFCRLYGFETEELLGQEFTMVAPEASKEELRSLHASFVNGATDLATTPLKELQTEWTVINREGKELTIIANAVLLLGDDGSGSKATFVTDITRQKAAEERLRVANKQLELHATRDELTSLYNRRAGLARLSKDMAQSRADERPLSVTFIDVDYFKDKRHSWPSYWG